MWAYGRELDDWLAVRAVRPERAPVRVAGAKRRYAWPTAVASLSLLCFLVVRRATPPQMPDPIKLTTLAAPSYAGCARAARAGEQAYPRFTPTPPGIKAWALLLGQD